MSDDDLKINRSFNVYVEHNLEGEGGDTEWIAHVVGPDGLDNITWADNPVGALYMAYDMLLLLTGQCMKDQKVAEHQFEAATSSWFDSDEVQIGERCIRCGMFNVVKPPVFPPE